MLRLGVIVTGGSISSSGNLSFTKITLDGRLGVEHKGLGPLWLNASATLRVDHFGLGPP
jgi:hypothetical protein